MHFDPIPFLFKGVWEVRLLEYTSLANTESMQLPTEGESLFVGTESDLCNAYVVEFTQLDVSTD